MTRPHSVSYIANRLRKRSWICREAYSQSDSPVGPAQLLCQPQLRFVCKVTPFLQINHLLWGKTEEVELSTERGAFFHKRLHENSVVLFKPFPPYFGTPASVITIGLWLFSGMKKIRNCFREAKAIFWVLEMCTLNCVFLPRFIIFVWPLTGRENVLHCLFTGYIIICRNIAATCSYKCKNAFGRLRSNWKKRIILFPYLQGRQYEHEIFSWKLFWNYMQLLYGIVQKVSLCTVYELPHLAQIWWTVKNGNPLQILQAVCKKIPKPTQHLSVKTIITPQIWNQLFSRI